MGPHWHYDHDWDYDMIRRNPSIQGPPITEGQALFLVVILLFMIVIRCCGLIMGHDDIEGHEDRHEHDE